MKEQRKRRKITPQQLRARLILGGAVLVLVAVIAVVAALLLRDRGPTAPETPEIGVSAGAWEKNSNGFYFNDVGEPIMAAVKKGIDVSKYQGEVDWAKAKAAGIDFAIIRCGFGSEWNGEGTYAQDDEYWERNADACTALGIPFGTYLYSYATTVAQAELEADHVARLLGLTPAPHEGLADYTDKPYQLSYPVYYDLEDKAITGLFPSEMAELVAAFFARLESYGYKGEQGLYASLNWVRARFDDPAYDPWRSNLWIARFASELGYTGAYSMWQSSYTEPGEKYGVQSETVDIDFVMEELELTGITNAEGKISTPSFTNDTYKNELWLGQKKDHATLQTNQIPDAEGQTQRVYWQSSDKKVATVDKDGTVKAVGEGVCTVTATLADGRVATDCTVRVGAIAVPVYFTGALTGQLDNGEITLADIAALKASEPDAILLDAGGSVQGTPRTSLTGGMDMTSAFSAAGYDLQCFDATDLAFGAQRLVADAVTARGPSLASNLRGADGTTLFYRSLSWNNNRITNGMNYVVKEAGKKIGFFSLASTGNSAHAADMFAYDMALAAAEQVAALRAQEADAIVCITGPDTDHNAVLADLASLGVSAVIAAAQSGSEASTANGVVVAPAGNGLGTVGRLSLSFSDSGALTATASYVTATTLAANRANLDETAAATYDRATNSLDSLAAGDAEVSAQTLFTFAENPDADRVISFGNYVAGVYEAYADGDRAHWPQEVQSLEVYALAGGITELAYGDISRGDLLGALPGGARLQLVQTTGSEISRLVETGLVSQTYQDSLVIADMTDGDVLLITDTDTLKLLTDQNFAVLRDYGDVFWDIRMNINDVTNNFADPFMLPEAPRYGVGRSDVV